MDRASLNSRLRSVSVTLKPTLRIIGLAYTGLGGMLATVLVVSVALVPVSPQLQQATQPARQAVSDLVQPTSDAVTSFFGGIPAPVPPLDHPAAPNSLVALADPINLDVTLDEPVESVPPPEPPLVVAAAWRAPAAVVETPAPEVVDEIVGVEPIEISSPRAVVAPAPTPLPMLQIAVAEVPKPLPTLPAPTETALQAKARAEAENRTAIDAE